MDASIIFQLLLIALGLYAMVISIKMKRTQVIPKWMTKGYKIASDSNVPAFIHQMYGTTLYVGVLLMIYGVYNIVLHYVLTGVETSNVVTIFFLIFAVSYIFILSGAKAKFLKRED